MLSIRFFLPTSIRLEYLIYRPNEHLGLNEQKKTTRLQAQNRSNFSGKKIHLKNSNNLEQHTRGCFFINARLKIKMWQPLAGVN